MIRFYTFYLHGQLKVIDLTVEQGKGRRDYVASLSEDPSVSFSSHDPMLAVTMLVGHMRRSPRWRPAMARAC